MAQIAFYVGMSLFISGGLVLMFKEAGWPSERERRNVLVRSLRGAAGGTLAGAAIAMLTGNWMSPGTFLSSWTVEVALRAFCFVVVPSFLILTAGSVVQFSIWERNRPKWDRRLREITRPKGTEQNEE